MSSEHTSPANASLPFAYSSLLRLACQTPVKVFLLNWSTSQRDLFTSVYRSKVLAIALVSYESTWQALKDLARNGRVDLESNERTETIINWIKSY